MKLIKSPIPVFLLIFSLFSSISPSYGDGGSIYRADLSNTQWGLKAVRAYEAWQVSKGKGVVVAVLDTGVDGTHPDLEGRVLAGYSSMDESDIEAGMNSDVDSHGTHVAGIIAGSDDSKGITGVAPEAVILPVQVLGFSGGSDLTVAKGIDWAVANGAKVLNLSLGGERNPFDKGGSLSCEAVGRAYDAGVVVIVAAGNAAGAGNPRNEPASCRGALSVAAVDEVLNRTFFSSFDESVGISAPGRRVVSSIPVGADLPYASWNGTSMAAPFVSGVAALIIAKNPGISAAEVVQILKDSSNDLGVTGSDPETGSGLVDAAAALGLSKGVLSKIQSEVSSTVVPLVISGLSDGERTLVKWEAPLGVSVESYYIRLVGTSGVVESEAINGFEGYVEGDGWLNGHIEVVALVNGVERVSLPFAGTDLDSGTGEVVPSPVMVSVTGKWVAEGLLAEFTTSGVEGVLDVTLLDWNYGLIFDGDVKSTDQKILIPVPVSSEARGHYAVLMIGSEGNRISFDVKPEYSFSAKVFTAGSNRLVVKGSTFIACLFDDVACMGSTVKVYSSSGKVIGTGRVMENLEFYVTITRKNTGSTVSVVIGKLKGPKIEVPEYKESK